MKILCVLVILFSTSHAGEVCYPDLGCFDNAPPFLDIDNRPLSLLPSSRDDINTTFCLNTPNYKTGPDRIISNRDTSTILASDFDFNLQTKFIIHGNLEIGDLSWMSLMGETILYEGNYNVIRVIWDLRPGNTSSYYAKMSSNARIVGAEIALLIDQLMELAPDGTVAKEAGSYHLIGRGIGAHVAGYAGERHNPKLGRISGLDPAGPYFEDTDLIVRLDHTDADFVDVIHTDTDPLRRLGMGMYQPTGHADFYPNGGREQPACPQRILSIIFLPGTIYEGGVQYFMCDHEKAHEMYLQSILSSCNFMASPSPDTNMANYIDGVSFDAQNAMPMGFHADKSYLPEGWYFQHYLTRTTEERDRPHCRSQYGARIFFDDPRDADEAHGFLYLRVGNDDFMTEKIYMSNTGNNAYEPGRSYYVTGMGNLFADPLTKIEFSWEYDGDWYNPISWDLFRNPDVYVSRIEVDSLDIRQSISFCTTAEDGLVRSNRDDVLFLPCA